MVFFDFLQTRDHSSTERLPQEPESDEKRAAHDGTKIKRINGVSISETWAGFMTQSTCKNSLLAMSTRTCAAHFSALSVG